MTFNQIKTAVYSLFVTNKFGLKFKKIKDQVEFTALRLKYVETILSSLNISVHGEGAEKLIKDKQYLIVSN